MYNILLGRSDIYLADFIKEKEFKDKEVKALKEAIKKQAIFKTLP